MCNEVINSVNTRIWHIYIISFQYPWVPHLQIQSSTYQKPLKEKIYTRTTHAHPYDTRTPVLHMHTRTTHAHPYNTRTPVWHTHRCFPQCHSLWRNRKTCLWSTSVVVGITSNLEIIKNIWGLYKIYATVMPFYRHTLHLYVNTCYTDIIWRHT